MRLIASLTMGVCSALLLSACAGNAPRKPATTEKSSARDAAFYDECYDAYSRGAPTPLGCPEQGRGTRRGTAQPGIAVPALEAPTLPGSDGLLRR